MKRLLTNSCSGEWQQCPRKFQLRYVQGYVPVHTPEALTFGTATHACLEVYWLTRRANGKDPLGAALAVIPSDFDPFDTVRLRVMLHAYAAMWDRTWCEVVAVEVPFEVPLCDPETGTPSVFWNRAGKIDLVLRDRARSVVIVEHKCLAGDARIFDHATGTYERAQDLYQRGVAPVVTAVNEGVVVTTKALVLRQASVRTIYRVATLGGRSLRVSGNHPVLTPSGWINAENLSKGSWVATPRHLASPKADASVSDESIRLIGYMIGDGSMVRMIFTKTDAAVLADVLRCAASCGEESFVRRPPLKAPYISFRLVGPVGQLMDRAGLKNKGSADKRLPFHLALSDRQLGQLLGALWSTDGCIDTFRGTKLRIIYTSRSRGLCEDIQHALQRLGVVANVRTTSVLYKGERRPVSTVNVVTRESRRRFLALVIESVIPVLRSKVSPEEGLRLIPTSLQGDDKWSQPRQDPGIWWDCVESVERQGEEITYDVEVPGLHNFVVDGIVTHNTSGEEIGPGSDYNRRLLLDTQVSTYLDGARAIGFNPNRIVYDVLKKPNERQLIATPVEDRKYTKPTKKDPVSRLYKGQREADETTTEYEDRILAAVIAKPEDHVMRAVVHRFGHEMDAFQQDSWEQAEMMRVAIEAGRFPRYTRNCFRFGKPCTYLSVCEGRESIENPMVFARLKDVHPELGRAPAA